MQSEKFNKNVLSKTNDLRNRILFTILILSVYRLGTYVPLPGIDPQSLQELMSTSQKGLLGMFNVFSGGAVNRMAIFALGIMPYISSSIIIQLLTGVSDYFKNLKNQGEIGRKKITQNVCASEREPRQYLLIQVPFSEDVSVILSGRCVAYC